MIALIQLVQQAHVDIDSVTVATIPKGIVALIGIEKSDTENEAEQLINRILHYRIFQDEQGKTNLSLKQTNGSLLLVPQFTLVADTQSGTRPGFSKGMPPAEGKMLFDYLLTYAKKNHPDVAHGQFGAHMQVHLCNDGPVTFLLQTK